MTGTPIIRTRIRYVVALVALAAAGAIGWHHHRQIVTDGTSNSELVYIVAFGWLLFRAILPYFHRDSYPSSDAAKDRLARWRINVAVPVHNEDPTMFLACLNSIAAQTRLPDRIHVVENGYPTPKIREVFEQWRTTSCPAGVEALFSHIGEASKRAAQVVAWDADPDMDIAMTVDSDVQLDPGAIANGIAPFHRRRVKSVAGLTVGMNHRKNLITRLIEAPYVCSFLNGRAANSMLNCVDVNCGTLAFYRSGVIRKYRDHYLNHTIAGRKFSYGDDAMLTRYALLEGHTVMQVSSWGFTLHPENLRHLSKQRLRWWRSYFWGNVWLLRTFSPAHVIWWLTAWKFVSFVWYSALIPAAVVIGPTMTGELPAGFFAWVLLVGALTQLRYLTIRRPDETVWSQLGTVAVAPLAALLNVYLYWGLQYIGLATCLKTGWSTRQQVEVSLAPSAAVVPTQVRRTVPEQPPAPVGTVYRSSSTEVAA